MEIGNGKRVYIPTELCRKRGSKLIKQVYRRWSVNPLFFHMKKGGHVSALKSHIGKEYFLKLDIENFFPSIHRNRITRRLKTIGYSFLDAEDFARDSTVKSQESNKFVLPFGFVQSSMLASLDLHFSKLGGVLSTAPNSVNVSVYVDDIIISGNDKCELEAYGINCQKALIQSEYIINQVKSVLTPQQNITAFNIELSQDGLRLSDSRLKEFEQIIRKRNDVIYSEAIYGYLKTINLPQSIQLYENYPEYFGG